MARVAANTSPWNKFRHFLSVVSQGCGRFDHLFSQVSGLSLQSFCAL